MSKYRLSLGRSSENEALNYLARQGYKILEANYKNKLGEIDIVAKDKNSLCFIEIKSRSSQIFGLPKEAVDRRKQQRICRLALTYLKERGLLGRSAVRFDVLSIGCNSQEPHSFELIKDAFSAEDRYSY
jgi:putative endonuclease